MKARCLVVLLVPVCLAVPNARQKRDEQSGQKTIALPGTVSEMLNFNAGSSNSQLFSMPSNCTHEGKIFQQGEKWNTGHLRYRCGKFGVYEILGCRTDKDKPLEIGQTFVEDNVAHQCFRKESAIYYRQSVCGIFGQPDCDKLTTDTVQSPSSGKGFLGQGLPALQAAGLPEGWKIVDANGKPIPLASIRVISRTIPVGTQRTVSTVATAGDCNDNTTRVMFAPQRKRARRQSLGTGVGSAVPVDVIAAGEMHNGGKERVVGVGTGSVSLDARTPTVTVGKQQFKPGTVGAVSRSDVGWSGKTEMHNGRRIAVGPGTFTIRSGPTGTSITKSN